MPLFANIPKIDNSSKSKSNTAKIKLKKGETISSLILTAKELVEEKLKKYKEVSKCITDLEDLKKFFNNTLDDAEIGIDTETTG